MTVNYVANRPRQLKEWLHSIKRDPGQIFRRKGRSSCSCCGYKGPFVSLRRSEREDDREKRCPNCSSRPRDRLLAYLFAQRHIELEGKHILHFSPEPNLFRRLKNEPHYISGDIKKNKYAAYEVDVTRIPYPDNTFDVIICNHVMEHVQDHMTGFSECLRVLKPDGAAFFSVPYYPEREETWYPPADMPEAEIDKLCGLGHRRLYGRDFTDIVASAGFEVEPCLLSAEEAAIFRTDMNDPIFIARKLGTI